MKTAHDWVSRHRSAPVVCCNCGHVFRFTKTCKDRFCEQCSKKRKGRLINAIEPVIENMLEPHFVTLTIRRKKLSKELISELRRSFTKLRHRKVWLNAIYGFYNIELGTIDLDGTCNAHIHCVYDGLDIFQPELSWNWSKVADGYVVYIESCESKTKVMHYVTKHFAKCPTTALDEQNRANLNHILKGIRLLQPFGPKKTTIYRDNNNKLYCRLPIKPPPKQGRCPQCGADSTALVWPWDPLYYDVLSASEDGFIAEMVAD